MKTARREAGLFVICGLAPLDDYDDLNAKHAVPPVGSVAYKYLLCALLFIVFAN
jgi:hypothetical protein